MIRKMLMWGQPPPAVRSSEARVVSSILQGKLAPKGKQERRRCSARATREKSYDGGRVIAPCDADETSAAYFAKTPVG